MANCRISSEVEEQFRSDPEKRVEVLLVLKAQPTDLSQEVTAGFSMLQLKLPSAPEPGAEERIRERLTRLGLKDFVWLGNAGSVVVRLNRREMDELVATGDVEEVVPNARLK